jgi:hypothetical protein
MGREDEILMEYGKQAGLKVFVETGTGEGKVIGAMVKSQQFDELHTIDDSLDSVQRVKNRWKIPKLHCWRGDSATHIPRLLKNIHEPVLFYLNAHPAKKEAHQARGKIKVPLWAELEAILKHECAKDHVICIGDALYYQKLGRRFKAFPSIKEITEIVKERRPDWTVEVKDNVICCCKEEGDAGSE